MANWKVDQNSLYIESKGIGKGCIYTFVLLFSIICVVAASAAIYFSYQKSGFTDTILFAGIFLHFGLVGIIGTIYGFTKNQRSLVELNKIEKKVKLFGSSSTPLLSISFGELDYIRLVKFRRSNTSSSRTGGSSYTVYQSFLVKKDGGNFWLDNSLSQSHFIKEATMLADFLKIKVIDESESGLSREAEISYEKPFASDSPFLETSAKSFKINQQNWGKEIILVEKGKFIEKLLNFLAISLFINTPITIFGSSFDTANDGLSMTILSVFATIFGSFLIAFLFIYIAIQTKKYKLIVKGNDLIIELKFFFNPLNKRFGKTLIIPKHNIKNVRVNRIELGHFWLSLELKDYNVSTFTSALFGMGIFSKNKLHGEDPHNPVIGLWEVSSLHEKDGSYASYTDLLFMEKWLEKELGVEKN